MERDVDHVVVAVDKAVAIVVLAVALLRLAGIDLPVVVVAIDAGGRRVAIVVEVARQQRRIAAHASRGCERSHGADGATARPHERQQVEERRERNEGGETHHVREVLRRRADDGAEHVPRERVLAGGTLLEASANTIAAKRMGSVSTSSAAIDPAVPYPRNRSRGQSQAASSDANSAAITARVGRKPRRWSAVTSAFATSTKPEYRADDPRVDDPRRAEHEREPRHVVDLEEEERGAEEEHTSLEALACRAPAQHHRAGHREDHGRKHPHDRRDCASSRGGGTATHPSRDPRSPDRETSGSNCRGSDAMVRSSAACSSLAAARKYTFFVPLALSPSSATGGWPIASVRFRWSREPMYGCSAKKVT
jgi:hypothetical protein